MATLDDNLVPLLGQKTADALDGAFGIRTVDDLLHHFPRSYTEGAKDPDAHPDEPPRPGEHVTLVDTITYVEHKQYTDKRTHRRKEFMVVTLGQRRPPITATFFNPRVIKHSLVRGARVMLSGEVGFYKETLQLTHPAFFVLDHGGKNVGSASLKAIAGITDAADDEELLRALVRQSFPIYPATKDLQSWTIFACVRQVLEMLDPVPDPIPAAVLRDRDLVSEDRALRDLHLAESRTARQRAIERLRFDEAVGLQWALAQRRYGEISESGPAAPRTDGGLVAKMLGQLPFELTAGQREILGVLSSEASAARPMNRLLQGEVGSGKTIISVLAMLQMVDAGYQCALLAPTEVLAAQHARSIRDILGPLGMAGQLGGAEGATRVALLTGSMTAAQKRAVRAEVAGGEAGLVVGTHALLQDAVDFHRLGMVVVDEQHRFGVEQRDALRAKAPAGLTPHLLVMTATPIPRTVALTYYGDLETSTLRELPRGRQPITTRVIFAGDKPQWVDRAWARISEEVAAGRQAYVVAPRIDEADENAKPAAKGAKKAPPAKDQGPPMTKAVELYDKLRHGELAALRVGLMHGRLTAEEKDQVMNAFRAGDVDVLVSTTVIEVGVDVPNATVMMIMDADRFGISQLHQLRGRVGRGAHASLCLLHTMVTGGGRAGARLNAVAETLDGFKLADLDLEERHEGDVLGRNQSGRPIGLKLLSLGKHLDVIEAAREFCDDVYAHNPDVDNPKMVSLARRFVVTEQIDYMDKS